MPASNLCIYISIQIYYQSWLRVEDVFNGIALQHNYARCWWATQTTFKPKYVWTLENG